MKSETFIRISVVVIAVKYISTFTKYMSVFEVIGPRSQIGVHPAGKVCEAEDFRSSTAINPAEGVAARASEKIHPAKYIVPFSS